MISILFLMCLMGEICDFQAGEFIVFKFDGPASYSYTLKGGEARNYTVDNEDKLLLENKNIGETNQEMSIYLRIGPDGVQLFPGLDKDLKLNNGDLVYSPESLSKYLDNAVVFNFAKAGGPLNNADPIALSGNFVGVETHRKDFVCKKGGGEINADKKVPYKDCGDGTKEYTGQMVVTTYDKAALLEKMASGQNTMLASNSQSPLELIVKNVGTAVSKDSTTTEGAKPPSVGSGSQASETKAGCTLSPYPEGQAQSHWGILGILIGVSASMGLMRRKQTRLGTIR